jgi:hypothetical protein
MDAVKRGRTFMSTGPLLSLDVGGRGPGDEISLAAGAPATLRVKVEAIAIAPLDSLQILVNGAAVRTIPARDSLRVTFDADVPVPDGGWVAARALGPASRYYGDDYAFAQTSPVYVVRGGRRYLNADDVRFLSETVDAIWARVERSAWRSDAERERFRAAVDSAKAVYARLAAEAGGR